ncbi:MAG: hypothetical protein EOO68_40930 [Moraxellaceae bacterium]|nr:MAG: hypothetical protein EOO68_40930 [Moraxellaceae bacterium]
MPRFSRPTINERAPTTVNPTIERTEETRVQNIDRSNQRSDVNNRPTRVDDSSSRRVQQEQRGSPRAERGNSDANTRAVRGRSNEDNR